MYYITQKITFDINLDILGITFVYIYGFFELMSLSTTELSRV